MVEQTQQPSPNDSAPTRWERQIIEKLLTASLREQRRARRWNVFVRLLFFVYAVVIAVAFWPEGEGIPTARRVHTAVIDVTGAITATSDANAERIIAALDKAADNQNARGIVLRMNTPGGSPVQSAYVYNAIRKLKAQRPEFPVYAVVTDICASGGYYIAAATDKIYVSPASIVGSIGVVMNGFGLVGMMDKLGVERRLLTAGANKALLDQFSPVDEKQKTYVQGVLNQIHAQFIDAVRTGRGARLKDDPNLFTGLIWTGSDSIKLGLADGIASTAEVAKDMIGTTDMVNYTKRDRLFDRLSHQIGAAMGRVFSEFASTLLQNLSLR